MYAGQALERGAVADVLSRPAHPYTRALLESIPDPAHSLPRLRTIPGQPPDLLQPIQGCAFAPRCARRSERCELENPELTGDGVACHHPEGHA
jgi:oligopeptide/dipeptide ABC transporter ATP-binding protein